MPTKFLVVETPTFQLGANAGATTERSDPGGFADRLKRHFEAAKAGCPDILFVLAPAEIRLHPAFTNITSTEGPLSIAWFNSQDDAIRFLPSLLVFDGGERSGGVKELLTKDSTIYSETLFNGTSVGSKLDPCFVFARGRLAANVSAQAWACLQALVFLGLQQLPDVGEKGTGEKVDVQLGADDRLVAFTVRFDLPPEQLPFLRANPILTLPRFSAGAFELRYVADAKKAELTCIFFRGAGPVRPVDISSYQATAALEDAASVRDYQFKTFGAISGDASPAKKPSKGGFKKKFSDQVGVVPAGKAEAEGSTTVKGGASEDATSTVVSGPNAPYKDPKVVVSGNASLVFDRETVFKNENAANRVIELEAQVRSLNAALKTRDELLAKATKDQTDPNAKRDVLTNLKDTQSEGLKQTVKNLETELNEAKEREMELMKMVDKAVQMKDEAAKKIKELDLKLKQASSGGGSKVQMLEKALDEQKRQNKELSKRVSELNGKLRAA